MKMNTLDTFLDDTRRAALITVGDLQDAIAARYATDPDMRDDTPAMQDAIARMKAHFATLETLRDHGIA